MSKDLSFLEPKDTDDKLMVALKAKWRMLMDLPIGERRVYLQQERVMDEEHHLNFMLEHNKESDKFIKFAVHRADGLVTDYNISKDEKLIELAEQFADSVHSSKQNKYTVKHIREQRHRIWQEKRKLKTMQQELSTEPKQS